MAEIEPRLAERQQKAIAEIDGGQAFAHARGRHLALPLIDPALDSEGADGTFVVKDELRARRDPRRLRGAALRRGRRRGRE